MKKNTNSRHISFKLLVEHSFVKSVFDDCIKISKSLTEKGSLFKIKAKYKRNLKEVEWYCQAVASALAHLLNLCQQLEHSILYFSSFSPTERMKKAGISRATHLLYSVENYIIKTQSVYDRMLILINNVFDVGNQENTLTHELIVTNAHVKYKGLPNKLKK